MTSYKVIEDISSCQRATTKLEQEEFIAVDSEGVNLSKTGPLTLVQIGTAQNRVYLFDVMQEPRMFEDGGLKRLLESDSVIKVLHSAKNDGEALHEQHGVSLHNVHDTQVAFMELSRAAGLRFPPRLRLEEICDLYCPEKAAMLKKHKDIDKDSVQTKLRKLDGEYWARRPLTPEMIHYAVHDVMALIPEVFIAQKLLLENQGLLESSRARVEQEIRSTWEPEARAQHVVEEKELIRITLEDFARQTTSSTLTFQQITDQNVRSAVGLVRMPDIDRMEFPQFTRELKLQQVKTKLDDVEGEIEQKGDTFQPNSGVCGFLWSVVNTSSTPAIIKQAKGLQATVARITLDDMKNKYTITTPPAHVAEYEKRIISHNLRPSGEHDPGVHPVLLRLFWKIRQEELEASIAQYRKKPFAISEGFAHLLGYYTVSDVPTAIKSQGTEFLQYLRNAHDVT
ncbi:uncharacterized protein [Littorina saxatilis]|uniref:3'-5' exonuclease domain-containing protein n=1 Tax=Littorina saxatilis TaxID=31220 RepID=A0AAN9G3F4_9CAEN